MDVGVCYRSIYRPGKYDKLYCNYVIFNEYDMTHFSKVASWSFQVCRWMFRMSKSMNLSVFFRSASLLISSCTSSPSWSSDWWESVSFTLNWLFFYFFTLLTTSSAHEAMQWSWAVFWTIIILNFPFSCGGVQWKRLPCFVIAWTSSIQHGVCLYCQRPGSDWGNRAITPL